MNAVERDHPAWTHAFSEQTRDDQLHEDSSAWRAVTGILITIVTVGVCLAVFTVSVCILASSNM